MKTDASRPWRKYRFRAALLLSAASLALAAGSAQGDTGGASSGVASEAEAGSGIVFTALRWAGATWYGPGFYGSRTACGQVLGPHTIGVAHRNLPCGTAVKFVYRGHAIVTRVIDRGPYSRGNAWDLTNGARRALHFDGSGRVGYAVAVQYARNSG
ncbi:MAG TPA: septal ring lytic transglycosylase RlpA family protein [Solirubrobacterales bacterium]|nr:septal ring lytic transglycosylase RlpA family protein [Solirubrobacterales bacterium]